MKNLIKYKFTFLFFAIVLTTIVSCKQTNEEIIPTDSLSVNRLSPPNFSNASGPIVEYIVPKQFSTGRISAESQMTRVDNRYLSAGEWQNVFTTASSGWDLTATYKGQIYNYGGGLIDLYVYNYVDGWKYLGGTSGNGNPKSFTFTMKPGLQHYFWAYCWSGSVRFDAALYKITSDANGGVGVTFNKSIVTGSNYRHFCQLNGALYPGYACIPTSYMIARGIVYANRPISREELTRISRGMSLQSWGTSIVNASNFAKSDIGYCNPTVQASSSITWAKNYIKDAIDANRPLLAVTNLRSQHIVTVIGLKLTNSDDTSEIYYIDPYDRNAGVRAYKLSSFLASMRAASSYGYHNLLRIGC